MCKTPEDLDLRQVDEIAIDLETYDPNLKTKGLGAIRGDGFVCGVAIATGKDTVYFPLSHSDTHLTLDKKLNMGSSMKNLFKMQHILKYFTMQCTTCVGLERSV